MGLFSNLINILSFNETIFLKETTTLNNQYEALYKLSKEYPNNNEIKEELYLIKKGLDGEKEIKYQLSKANLGLFVIQDLNIEVDNLKAQIDFVVVAKHCCYFIECKNLLGNITINENGDFIREYVFNNKKVRKGMYSPIRQVEIQRDIYKKIWNTRLNRNPLINNLIRVLSEDSFKDIHRVLVVAANRETILFTKYAPYDIKNRVIKSDALVRYIKYDMEHSQRNEWNSSNMEKWANAFLNLNVDKKIDYYEYYKNKFCVLSQIDYKLKNELIEFRTLRAKKMNIPAYYILSNEELDKLVYLKPKSVQELINVIPSIKIRTHGKDIINKINDILK